MKQLGTLVVVVGALIGSMAWGQQPLKAAGQDAKPWVLHDQNELSGVAVDLTRAISKQIGVPIEYYAQLLTRYLRIPSDALLTSLRVAGIEMDTRAVPIFIDCP
jgi:ABC-type amino acid transport substrate-binding protein